SAGTAQVTPFRRGADTGYRRLASPGGRRADANNSMQRRAAPPRRRRPARGSSRGTRSGGRPERARPPLSGLDPQRILAVPAEHLPVSAPPRVERLVEAEQQVLQLVRAADDLHAEVVHEVDAGVG